MQNEIIIAGFGGQGVLFIGKVISYFAIENDLEVTWFPSYGPAMRGGTANCTVVISDEEIGSPQVLNPKAAIVMNQPSLDKYENLVKPGGYLIVNTSLVNRPVKRNDIVVVEVPATAIAEEIGDKRYANVVLLGALTATADFLDIPNMEKGLRSSLKGKKAPLFELNLTALHKGVNFKQ
ncbi:MAG: 2-oxoacid:acceptor oxidoreductase family protein [Anaerolineaceae bacterium]|nr:2-oxoacid:acceptor oxidoreductase family protein [Anaerolineaceae bacterium]